MNLRERLKAVGELKTRIVEYEDEKFTVQEFSGAFHDEFTRDAKNRVKFIGKGKNIQPDPNSYNPSGQKALVVAMGLIDEEGKLQFDHKKKEDLDFIDSLSNNLNDILKDAILDLSGLTEEAKDEAEKK